MKKAEEKKKKNSFEVDQDSDSCKCSNLLAREDKFVEVGMKLGELGLEDLPDEVLEHLGRAVEEEGGLSSRFQLACCSKTLFRRLWGPDGFGSLLQRSRFELPFVVEHVVPPYAVQLSRDCRVVAVLAPASDPVISGAFLVRYEIPNRHLRPLFLAGQFRVGQNHVAVSDSGRYLAAVNEYDSLLRLWSSNSEGGFLMEENLSHGLDALTFSPNEQLLAVAQRQSHSVLFLRVPSMVQCNELALLTRGVDEDARDDYGDLDLRERDGCQICFSPNGERLIEVRSYLLSREPTDGRGDVSKFLFWSSTGQCLTEWSSPGIRWSNPNFRNLSSSEYIFAVTRGGTDTSEAAIEIWNAANGQLLMIYPTPSRACVYNDRSSALFSSSCNQFPVEIRVHREFGDDPTREFATSQDGLVSIGCPRSYFSADAITNSNLVVVLSSICAFSPSGGGAAFCYAVPSERHLRVYFMNLWPFAYCHKEM